MYLSRTISYPHKAESDIELMPDFSGCPIGIELVHRVYSPDLGDILIRPLRVNDGPLLVQFQRSLSEQCVHPLDESVTERLCSNSPNSLSMAFERLDRATHTKTILAVGRITKGDLPYTATLDSLFIDSLTPSVLQSSVLQRIVLIRLIVLAQAFGFTILMGELLCKDIDTIQLCFDLGFVQISADYDGGIVKLKRKLQPVKALEFSK